MTKDDLARNLANARQFAAIATAFTLPFSTSGQAIAITIFAVLALLTLDRARLIATLRKPVAYLPIALFALVMAGVVWSIQPFGIAIKGILPYVKLLLIPLVMATAFSPKQALQIGYGFVAACLFVVALSYISFLWPNGPFQWFKSPGVPFKDNAVQSECLALSAFGLAVGAAYFWTVARRLAVVMAVLALLLFADVFLIYISKTGMMVTATLLGLFLIQMNGWRRALLIGIPALAVIMAALWVSPAAQKRIAEISVDLNAASTSGQETVSTASRLDFWSKAKIFVKDAPLLGHGTGSIHALYQSMEATRPSPYGQAVTDPHNQFLHITLQIGLVGGLILLAMWISHIKIFLGRDIASLIGLAVVVQNILGSLFNSHISQVTQGMIYCLAVGLLGSVVLYAKPKTDVAAPDAL